MRAVLDCPRHRGGITKRLPVCDAVTPNAAIQSTPQYSKHENGSNKSLVNV